MVILLCDIDVARLSQVYMLYNVIDDVFHIVVKIITKIYLANKKGV